jgi:peptidoglycan/LPS O-acetylase OafA/YrhL
METGSGDAAADRPLEQPVGTPRHFPCFDGLRAIAVTSVLLLHTAWVSGFTERNSLGVYTSRLEIGVSIFFLISGFLLYRPFALSHLTARRSPNTARFYVRRLLRIVPAYWLALTLLAYVFHLVTMGPGWQGVVTQYLFLQIYFPTQIFFGITQAWSLCTEMSFYLVLPLYAWVVRRAGGARRSAPARLASELIGVGILFAASFVFRYWVLHRPLITVSHGKFVALCAPNCSTRATFATLMVDWLPAYLDLFALGMLLAVLSVWYAEHRSEPRWLQHRLMPWVSWLLAAVSFWAVSHIVTDRNILYFVTPRVNLEKQTLYGIFAFLIIVPAVFGPQDRSLVRQFLRWWPVASVGVISYGIYLWHLNLIFQFLDWTGWQRKQDPFWLLALAVFALSASVASASYFGLERPILRVKGRLSWWDRGRRDPLSVVAGDTGAHGTGPPADVAASVPERT